MGQENPKQTAEAEAEELPELPSGPMPPFQPTRRTVKIGDFTGAVVPLGLSTLLAHAAHDKRTYADKLEQAQGDDVFKYLLLMNASALEQYVTQTRLQAEQSFRLSRVVAIVGFVLLAISIGLGVYINMSGGETLDVAYLSGIAGVLTEFISGVFFYLYNRTLQQLNLFHNRMLSAQHVATALLTNSRVADTAKRDDGKVELAKVLISAAASQMQGPVTPFPEK